MQKRSGGGEGRARLHRPLERLVRDKSGEGPLLDRASRTARLWRRPELAEPDQAPLSPWPTVSTISARIPSTTFRESAPCRSRRAFTRSPLLLRVHIFTKAPVCPTSSEQSDGFGTSPSAPESSPCPAETGSGTLYTLSVFSPSLVYGPPPELCWALSEKLSPRVPECRFPP